MKLDDLVGLAGDHPLSDFEWSTQLVLLFNNLVAEDYHLNVSMTGKQAHDKMRSLPLATLMTILTQDIQVQGNKITFVPTVDTQTPVPPTVPPTRRMSPLAIVLMVVMTLISLTLAVGTLRNPDSKANADTLQMVVRTMVDVLKEENSQENQAAKPPEKPQEPVAPQQP